MPTGNCRSVFRSALGCAILTGVACSLLCAFQLESPSRTAIIAVEFGLGKYPDRWYNGYFVQYERSDTPGENPKVWSFDKDGSEVLRKTEISIPDAYHTIIHSAAADRNGDVLASVEIRDASGSAATALCRIKPPGKLVSIVRTDGFAAKSLAVSPDGQIWAFGTKRVGNFDRKADFQTVERYDAGGKPLSRLLWRSSFGVPFDPAIVDNLGEPKIIASSSRVGVYSPGAKYWAECTASGDLIHSFKVEPPVSPVIKKPATIQGPAMTEANQVYAWFLTQHRPGSTEPSVSGIYQLDRGKQAWVLVARESLERFMGLYGVDGDSLILRSGCCRHGWFAAPNIVP